MCVQNGLQFFCNKQLHNFYNNNYFVNFLLLTIIIVLDNFLYNTFYFYFSCTDTDTFFLHCIGNWKLEDWIPLEILLIFSIVNWLVTRNLKSRIICGIIIIYLFHHFSLFKVTDFRFKFSFFLLLLVAKNAKSWTLFFCYFLFSQFSV